MAITDSYSLSNALNSQAYAYKCWYNYNYGNNTMGISSSDMGEITQTWNGELDNWKATALDDENAYEIEDDDYSLAKQNGREIGEDATGYDGSQTGQITNTVADATSSVAGATGAAVSLTGKFLGETVGTETAKTISKVAVKKGGETLSNENATKKLGAYAAAVMTIAAAVKYQASKPNKEQKEACDDLQDEMANSESALYCAQDDMSSAGDEVIELTDEADTANEDANETIEEDKTLYDSYMAAYEELIAKVEAGETLSDDEKELLEELVPLMQELGVDISETSEETTEVTQDIYDDMGDYEETYDNAAETMGEVEGLTDYAESFDSSTKTMCYVEGAAQTLNAASGAKAAAKLFAGPWWNYAIAAASAAAAVRCGIGAAEQFEWASKVGEEIDMRNNAQDINSDTSDIYDESIADYEGYMGIVEDLELEIPEDMEDFDETIEGLEEGAAEALGTGDSGSTTATTAFGTTTTSGSSSSTGSSTSGSSGSDDKDKEL